MLGRLSGVSEPIKDWRHGRRRRLCWGWNGHYGSGSGHWLGRFGSFLNAIGTGEVQEWPSRREPAALSLFFGMRLFVIGASVHDGLPGCQRPAMLDDERNLPRWLVAQRRRCVAATGRRPLAPSPRQRCLSPVLDRAPTGLIALPRRAVQVVLLLWLYQP
jgi:hypothetical protein